MTLEMCWRPGAEMPTVWASMTLRLILGMTCFSPSLVTYGLPSGMGAIGPSVDAESNVITTWWSMGSRR
jgi:hypothetical protein